MYFYLVYLEYYALQEIDKMTSKMVDYKDFSYECEEQYGVRNYSDLVVTLSNLMEEIRTRKADNDQIIHEQEKQTEVNVILLQCL